MRKKHKKYRNQWNSITKQMTVRCKCDEDIFIIQYLLVWTFEQSQSHSSNAHYRCVLLCGSIVVVVLFLRECLNSLLGYCVAVRNIVTFETLAKTTIVFCVRCTQWIRVDTMSKIKLLFSSGVHSKLHNNYSFIGRFPYCEYLEIFRIS